MASTFLTSRRAGTIRSSGVFAIHGVPGYQVPFAAAVKHPRGQDLRRSGREDPRREVCAEHPGQGIPYLCLCLKKKGRRMTDSRITGSGRRRLRRADVAEEPRARVDLRGRCRDRGGPVEADWVGLPGTSEDHGDGAVDDINTAMWFVCFFCAAPLLHAIHRCCVSHRTPTRGVDYIGTTMTVIVTTVGGQLHRHRTPVDNPVV